MITTWTLIIIIYAATGLSTQSSIFISEQDCKNAGKVAEDAIPRRSEFICYPSKRIDVK